MTISKIEYDGSQLKRHHYELLNEENLTFPASIIVGRGPSKVLADHMCDLEDLKAEDFIYSADMIHFLIEIPNNTDLFAGVLFQRFFNTRLCEKLNNLSKDKSFKMAGDDILENIDEKRKFSVSIAATHSNSIFIHTGINVTAGDLAPSFARGVKDLFVNDDELNQFFIDFRGEILEEVLDIQIATAKVI